MKRRTASKLAHKSSAFGYPQLVLGMIAIFVYVGVEVSTISNLPAYSSAGFRRRAGHRNRADRAVRVAVLGQPDDRPLGRRGGRIRRRASTPSGC
jgi:hypothetical protein